VADERPISTELPGTGEDLLGDLPPEALKAASYSQFVNHMRPYAWVKFPSATAAEVNALIKVRWNLLKKAPKTGKGAGFCNEGFIIRKEVINVNIISASLCLKYLYI